MLDLTKKYRTRDGREVTSLQRINEEIKYPIIGIVNGTIKAWTENGLYVEDWQDDFDLVEVPETPKKKLYLAFNKNEEGKVQWVASTTDKDYLVTNHPSCKIIEVEYPEI